MPPGVLEAAATGHYASANGLRIYFEEQGAGYPLLLLHGGFGTHTDWRSQVPALAPHFRVIMPDFRGHGRTDNPDGAISYELMAQDCFALIQTLGLEKPLIVGFSDGSYTALQMAVWKPDLATAFVFVGGWLWSATEESRRGMLAIQHFMGIDGPLRAELAEDDLRLMEQSQPRMVADLRAAHQHIQGPDNWKTYLKNMWPAWIRPTEHGPDELQRITAPTLVVVGDRDIFVPLKNAVELYQHLPNAEMAVIPGMDPDGPKSKRADLLSQIILHYLLRQVAAQTNSSAGTMVLSG
ncbi:MAG TPA: alpha/beta hydrolase [Ktedonobacterales bacterium]|nr:alpha/beta hydrolase [Ktedonobacterales bacterium]